MSYTNGLDDPTLYFNTKLYTGTGSTQSITGLNFQPDWVSIKKRSAAGSGNVYDSVRGALKHISTNLTAAEETESSGAGLTAFGSNGFTVGTEPTGNGSVNQSSQTYVAWNWKESATSGFDIVSYTGDGTDDDSKTISHSLSAAPNMIMVKCRSATGSWQTSSTALGWNNVLLLDTTAAQSAGTYAYGVSGVTPSSSTFTVSASSGGNHTNTDSATYIAYVWRSIQGFSKFGSYTGNGNADGTFVYTGFRPAWVMVKRTDTANSWCIFDNKRPGYNETNQYLLAEDSRAELTDMGFEILSNGFKLRQSYNSVNASGGTYIYMAFAENPFVTSTGIPTTAR